MYTLVPAPGRGEHLAVDPVAQSMFGEIVPDKSRSGIVRVGNALLEGIPVILRALAAAIERGPDLCPCSRNWRLRRTISARPRTLRRCRRNYRSLRTAGRACVRLVLRRRR